MKSKNKKAIVLTAIIAVSVFIAIPSIASELSNKTVTIDTSSASKVKNILQIENVKSNLTDAQKKLSTDLLQLVNSSFLPEGQNRETLEMQMKRLGQFHPASSVSLARDVGRVAGDLVYVYVYLKPPAGTPTIEPYVWEVTDRDKKNHLAVAWVEVKDLETLASLEAVQTIRTVMPPLVRAGSVTTEGDAIHRTSDVRATYSQNGSGIKVGIISDGVNSWTGARDSGDLPADLNVLSDTRTGDEGTAMLEIVHDMVPEADLYFHDCGDNTVAFKAAIAALVNAGCDVICDDIGWITQPFFEDGTVASNVTDVLDSNDIIYVSSAGNAGEEHYQGDYYNIPSSTQHDFSHGGTTEYYLYLQMQAGGSVRIVLQWNDQFGSSGNDYDLYLYSYGSSSYVAGSTATQDDNGDPLEFISYTVPGGTPTADYAIIVDNYNGTATTKTLEVFIYPSSGTGVYPYNINATDSIFGHPAVPNAIAVGAIAANDPGNDAIEPFSSQGPVTISYPSSISRPKPDLCGIDGVTVTGAGGFGYWDGSNYRFYGTSAAAPHIAAIAAQLWGAFPAKTSDEIRAMLYDSAVDLGSAEYDNVYGYGRADALDAFEGENQPPTLSSGNVTPSSGDTTTIFNYYVTYTDSDGDAPTAKYVYIDGSSHTMTKISGDYTSGATFNYSTTLSAGTHNYYFYFSDGHGHTVRLPTSGTYSGPSVTQPDTTPPASITSLNASDIGPTWINWTWINPSDVDFTYVAIWFNDAWDNTTANTTNYYNATGLEDGTQYTISTHSVDANGNVNHTWVNDTVTTIDITPPASITNLQNTTENFWINWTWDNPPDSDFSHTMVYINGSLKENVTRPKNYYNATYLPHATKTISTQTVDENGNVNSTWIDRTTTIPNNPPVLEAIGDKTVDEHQTLTIHASATDLDNDILVYSCNRTDLFTDFSTTTGIGHWTPAYGQAGIYYVDFGVSDGYNGMDNESVKIIVVDKTPPSSITNLNASDIGLIWINWTWIKPTDDDFNHTMVYLDGNWRTNTSYPYYNATGLNLDTSYEIGTHTVDKLGNINTTWVNQTNKTLSDKTPPTYSQVSSDNTEVGEPALLSAYWCDDIGLNGFNLSTNNSGSWINTSYPMTGQCNQSNATIILNSTAHLTIGWIIHAKDTFGNWNNTGVQTIITADTKPPIVTSATANPPTIFADGTHGTLLNVTATDISGIKSVTVNLSSIGGSETQELQNNSGVWQCTANTTINGTFELPVNVTDNEGNSNTTATISLKAVSIGTDLIFTYRDSLLTTPADIFEDNATVFVVVTDGNTTGGNKAITVNNTYSESINVTVYDNGTNYDATADDKNYTGYFNIASGVTNDNTDELRLNEGDTATITANLANDSLAGTKTISRASKCFIATAAYGTSLHENIDILRSFRDKVLMQTSPGGALVTTYYSTSPPIADALAKNEGLRSAVRLLLLTPLVYFAERILSGIGLIAVVFLGLGVFFGRRRYIKVVLKAIGLGLSTAVVLTGTVFALGWLAYTYPVCAVIAAYILPFIIPAAIGAGAMVLVLWKSKNHEIAQD